jgi:hypothetical protein
VSESAEFALRTILIGVGATLVMDALGLSAQKGWNTVSEFRVLGALDRSPSPREMDA